MATASYQRKDFDMAVEGVAASKGNLFEMDAKFLPYKYLQRQRRCAGVWVQGEVRA
jgi:hypothetical protein